MNANLAQYSLSYYMKPHHEVEHLVREFDMCKTKITVSESGPLHEIADECVLVCLVNY